MPSIFDLEFDEQDEQQRRAETNLLDPATMPKPAWANAGEQTKQLMQGSASAARSLAMVGAVDAIARDKVESLLTGKRTAHRQEAYFEHVVEGIGQRTVDFWTPDAAASGTAATTLGTVFNVVGRVPQILGGGAGATTFLTDAAMAPGTEVVRAGGSNEAALGAAGVSLVTNATGMRLPAAWGSNLLTRVGTGAGANLAVGAIQNKATQEILEADGLDELAASYDPTNPQAWLLDTVMGAAFGAQAHLAAPSHVAAVVTANNAHHFANGTLPGEPLSQRAATQHQDALGAAIEQVLKGEPVNVETRVNLADFELRPELVRTGFDDAIGPLLAREGGFVDNPADRGGATKFGISQRAHPGLDIANLTEADARAIYRREYWDGIGADKLPPAMRELAFDSAVNHGVGWTRQALEQAGGDPVAFRKLREAHYREIVANDPTQAQFLGGWLNRLRELDGSHEAPNFGLPEAPRTIPDEDPLWLAIPKRETVNIDTPEREAMRAKWVEEHFAGVEPTVLGEGERPIAYVMGGGGASGKGTILKALQAQGEIPRGIVEIDPDRIKTGGKGVSGIPEYRTILDRGDARAAAVVHEESSQVANQVKDRAIAEKRDFVLDRTLGDPAKALKELQALKDAGYEVRLFGVTLDAADAVDRAVKRATGSGRYVPLDSLLKAHKGFASGFEDYAALVDRARLYDNTVTPTVLAQSEGGTLEIVESNGYNQFRARRSTNEKAQTHRELHASTRGQAEPRSALAAEADRPGSLPEGNRGADGRGDGAQGEAGEVSPELQTALEAIAAYPDLQVMGEDGVVRSAADYLAEGEAEAARAVETARAVQAAANCLLRTAA